MSAILKVIDAVKYYGNGSIAVRALAGVSFEMQKGEFTAVMGPSGSGKTTLLSVISTIEPLSSGKIIVEGLPVSALSENELTTFRRDRLGFVFQEYNLLDTLLRLQFLFQMILEHFEVNCSQENRYHWKLH